MRGVSALQAYAGLEIGGVRMDIKGGGPLPAYSRSRYERL
jgi:hypothetical protein